MKYAIDCCRELIGSFNKIREIPPEIGKLRRLKRLVLNSNRIKTIPEEIGYLEMLEEFTVSENSVEELPRTIAKMVNLRILRLSSNKLRDIPFEVADILTLEEFNCANNPNLEMVPAKWRGDTESVLFTCRVHRGEGKKISCCHCSYLNSSVHFDYLHDADGFSSVGYLPLLLLLNFTFVDAATMKLDYDVRMAEMVRSNEELAKHAQLTEQENLTMKVGDCTKRERIESRSVGVLNRSCRC